MTRYVKLLLAVTLLLICTTAYAASAPNYLYQEHEFSNFVDNERYDDLIQAVKDFQIEHPLLMSDEWVQKISDAADQAKNAIMPELNSEYDPFEDINFIWFGDHKAVGQDEPYALFDGGKYGLNLSFYLPVDSAIYINSTTALVNRTDRVQCNVYDWDYKYIDSKQYETFKVYLNNIFNAGIEEINSLAFRFYGKNTDDYVDVFINDETVDYIRRIQIQMASIRNVQDVLWSWMKSVDNIVDEKIVPAWANKIIDSNPANTYPENIQASDYWNFSEFTESSIKNIDSDIGGVYFFRCKIKDVRERSAKSNSYWFVEILNSYGKYLTSAYIILDYAIDSAGFDPDRYSIGDEANIAAAYAGTDSWYRTLFILGYDETAVEIAKDALR